MKLTPTEILKLLGLTVPEDGIEVGEDLYFHQSMLTLLGRTMKLEAIPDANINLRHEQLRELVQSWGLETLNGSCPPQEGAAISRASMHLILRETYGFVDTAV